MKIICVIVALLFSASATAQNLNLRLDITPVERFYDLMSYIEQQNGKKLSASYGSIEQLRKNYPKQKKDSLRQQLIESLLETEPYSNKSVKYVWAWDQRGKDAYRITFNMLGKYCHATGVTMTADMPRQWVNYWNSPQKVAIETIRNTANSLEIPVDEVIKYLPTSGINDTMSMVLYYVADGNRGGYTLDNFIVMDVITDPVKKSSEIENIIAHELHHIYYRDWFNRHITTPPIDSNFRAAQRSFILEGTAQHFTFSDYSKPIQKLYSNKKLLAELLSDVENGTAIKDDSKLAIKRLWKYLPFAAIGNYSNRPTALYYLSFNIYRSIEAVGGRQMLTYVIENPKELIAVYNRLFDKEKMHFGPFSNTFEAMWRANL